MADTSTLCSSDFRKEKRVGSVSMNELWVIANLLDRLQHNDRTSSDRDRLKRISRKDRLSRLSNVSI